MTIYIDCIGIGKKVLRASFGIYRYVFNLLEAIKYDKNIDCNFKIITDIEDSEYYSLLIEDSRFQIVLIKRTVKKNIDYLNALKYEIKEIVKNDKNAVVFFPRGYFLTDIKNPKIITVHDSIPHYYWNKLHRLKALFIWRKIISSIKKAKSVIFVSGSTFNNVATIVNDQDIYKKSTVSYNSINYNEITQNATENIDEDYILTFYSDNAHKGYQTVLKSYFVYRKNGGKNKLFVIGAKKDCIDNENDIKYIKYQNDSLLSSFYKNAKVFVSLSEIEGFGFPIVEASCFGIPVVLSKIPVYYEILSDYGNAFFVNHFDTEEIALELKKLDGNHKLFDFKNFIENRYSLEKQKDDFVNIIDKFQTRG